jgi:hypothetical protein
LILAVTTTKLPGGMDEIDCIKESFSLFQKYVFDLVLIL